MLNSCLTCEDELQTNISYICTYHQTVNSTMVEKVMSEQTKMRYIQSLKRK